MAEDDGGEVNPEMAKRAITPSLVDAVKAYQRSLKYEPNSEIARHELQWIEQNRPH